MKLASLPYKTTTRVKQQLRMVGLNTAESHPDGSFKSCNNVSSEKYPSISVDKGWKIIKDVPIHPIEDREDGQTAWTFASSVGYWNDLIYVENDTTVHFGNANLGKSSALVGNRAYEFPKQYVVAGNKLCIFPDKVCIDMEDGVTPSLKRMGRDLYYVYSLKAYYRNDTDGTCYLQIPKAVDIDFRNIIPKDATALTISGCLDKSDDGSKTIALDSSGKQRISAHVIHFNGQWTTTGGTATDKMADTYRILKISESNADLDGVVPDLDFVCAKDNKIYGCSNKYQTIYVSAQGDPMDFGTYDGVATDAYAVAVGTPDKFTGCCVVGTSVCFFKQHYVHKLLGNYPAEYYLYQFNVEGVAEKFVGSLAVINDSAIYMGEHGLMRFSGSSATLMSNALESYAQLISRKQSVMSQAIFNGRFYILLMGWAEVATMTMHCRTFMYDTNNGVWTQNNDKGFMAICHGGSSEYAIDTAHIWELSDSNEAEEDWEIEFNPFIEATTSNNSTSQIFEAKKYTRLFFRLELPEGSTFKVEISMDGEYWEEVGFLVGDDVGVKDFRVSTERLDEFRLRISGTGKITIKSMEREFIPQQSTGWYQT